MQLSIINDQETQIDKLIETTKTKFSTEPKILPVLEHLKKLYSIIDKNRVDKAKFDSLVSKCQKSVDDTKQDVNDLATLMLEFIKCLEEFKIQTKEPQQKEVKKNAVLIAVSSSSEENKPHKDFGKDKEKEDKNESNSNSDTSNLAQDESSQLNNDQVEEEEEAEEEVQLTSEEARALANIKKLDTFCQKLNRTIIKYEKSELSFAEMSSKHSKHMTEETLKARFNKAYNKLAMLIRRYPHLCEVERLPRPHNTKTNVSFKKITHFEATRLPEVNAKVKNKLNSTREFPNYADVIEWVNEAIEECNLKQNQEQIERLARETFEEIGRRLKRFRQNDDIKIQNSRIQSVHPELLNSEQGDAFSVEDPALKDPEIEKILKENKQKADELCDEIFEEFSKKQANNEDFEDDGNDDEEDEDDDEDSEEEGGVEEGENLNKSDPSPEISLNESLGEVNEPTKSSSPSHFTPSLLTEQEKINLVQSVLKTKPNKRDSNESESNYENGTGVSNKKFKQEAETADESPAPTCSKTLTNNPKIVSSVSLAKKTANLDLSADEASCIVID